MRRIAALALLSVLCIAYPAHLRAQQGDGVAEYERQSKLTFKKQQKQAKRAAKKQLKAVQKAQKKQAKAYKKSMKEQKKHELKF
jgi:endonuclease/exonuclease/phosphatase (EEP) superfamily protein YafD